MPEIGTGTDTPKMVTAGTQAKPSTAEIGTNTDIEPNTKLNSDMFDDTVKNRLTGYNNAFEYLIIANIILLLLYSIYFIALGYYANHEEKDNSNGPFNLGKNRKHGPYIVGGIFFILFILCAIFLSFRKEKNKIIEAALTLADSMGNLYTAGLGASDTIKSMGTILTPHTGDEYKDRQTEQQISNGYMGAANMLQNRVANATYSAIAR
jgi:hypothetical protein